MSAARAKLLAFPVLGLAALVAAGILAWHRLARHDEERPAAATAPSQTVETAGRERTVGKPPSTHLEKEPYSPPRATAPELAALVDRSAKDRVTPDITSRIPRIRCEEDIPAVVSVLLDTEDDDTVRNEAANLLRRSEYPALTDALLKVLRNPKEGARFRAFCIQHLWMNAKADPEEPGVITSVLHRALEDRHVPVRREALLALVRMRDPKGKETAVEWLMAGKADGVRDAAIRCVRELDLREHTPIIRKHLRDESEVVRIAAIVTLSHWGDEESREAIKEAAKSRSFRLRRSAEMALGRLDRAAKAKGETGAAAKAPAAPSKRDERSRTGPSF